MNKSRRGFVPALLLFILSAVFLLSCASCAAGDNDVLGFLNYPVSADCALTLKGDGKPEAPVHFSLEVIRRGYGRLIFTDGELAGCVVSVAPEGVTISEGEGFAAPLDLPEGAPLTAVVAAFSISPEMISAQFAESGTQAGRISAVCAGGTAEISVSDGTPRNVAFSGPCGEFTVEIEKYSDSAPA